MAKYSAYGEQTHDNNIYKMSAIGLLRSLVSFTDLGMVTPAFSQACIKAEPAVAMINTHLM